MTFELAVGVVLALCSAGLLNTSYFLQHRASNQIGQLSVRRPLHSLRLLVSSPLWLVSFAAGWVGWGFYIASLRLAPLSVVQAISSGGLPLLAFIAIRFGKTVSVGERVAAMLGGLGAILVCASLGYHLAGTKANLHVVFSIVAVGTVFAAFFGWFGRTRLRPGAGLGVAAGLAYALSDIATKGAVDGTSPLLIPIFLAASLVGFALLQLSFQHGGVLQTAGLSSLITAVLPIAAGIAVYHEYLPPGALGWLRIIGFTLSVIAGAIISSQRLPDVPAGDVRTALN